MEFFQQIIITTTDSNKNLFFESIFSFTIFSIIFLILIIWGIIITDFKNRTTKIISLITLSILFLISVLIYITFNTVIAPTFATFIAILVAVFVFYSEKDERRKERITNQIKLLNGIIAELDIISSKKIETYFDQKDSPMGNLNWYKKEIIDDNAQSLDHDIHKPSIDKYITKIDTNICKKIDFSELTRSLSFLENKIDEINTYVKELKEIQIKYELELIKEHIKKEVYKEFLKNEKHKILESFEKLDKRSEFKNKLNEFRIIKDYEEIKKWLLNVIGEVESGICEMKCEIRIQLKSLENNK